MARMPAHDLQSRRLVALIEQLGDELERRPGWQVEVCDRIGISESVLSKIKSGDRGAGKKTLSRVANRLGIDLHYFDDEALGERPDYHRHRKRKSTGPGAGDPPFWADFSAKYERFGELSTEEIAAMQRLHSPHVTIRSWYDWAQLAEWVLGRRVAD